MIRLIICGILWFGCLLVGAQQPDLSIGDEARFKELAQRYRSILQNRPQRGTAFDQWYRHYLDAGRLEELAATVEEQAAKQPDDFAAQMIAGLVFERRGEDELAVEAYTRAERLAADNYYPAFLRGSLLAQQLQYAEAATALQKAIQLGPPRAELLEIFKKLGRLYLRQGQTGAATDTFRQMAETFPNDRQVLEELAELLTEENQLDEAIGRWEQVAALSKDDPYRQLLARVEVAQLQAQQGNVKTAVKSFDQTLDQLDPESWLAKDINRRIEETFQQKGDLNGLATYYFERLARHPDDLGTMVRLAGTFAQAGRQAEAIQRYQAAVKLAPSRRDIREAMIRELVRAGQFPEAIGQCEELAERHPGDVEVLRMLGQLHLDGASVDNRKEAELKAIETWNRIGAIRPQDPTLAVQVAEACRRAAKLPDHQAGFSKWLGSLAAKRVQDAPQIKSPLVTTAEAFYREAVRRSPGVPQYHEYLGEFLHSLGRKDQAVAAWSAIAAAPHDSAENWHRLAEVYNNFGYADEAVAAGERSLADQADNFSYQDLQVALLIKKKDYDRALQHVAQLDRLADAPLLEEKVLQRRVEVATSAGRVDEEIDRLRRLRADGRASMKDHWELALLLAHRLRYVDAADSLSLALRAAPHDIRLIKVHASMLERSGKLAVAVQLYRRLVELEPKNAATHFERIAQLELDRGNAAAAKAAADSFVRLAPANLDGHRLRADVAFKLGETDDGLNSLRHAVRIAPRDQEIRRHLAKSLADHKRIDEAVEHYWRCFELAETLNEKLGVVKALAELPTFSLTNQGMVERLRQMRRRQDDPRVLTLCIVEVLRWAKDYTGARRELTELLAVRRDDPDILKQLAALSEAHGDWENAVVYQERVVAQVPNRENLESLARLYKQRGDEAGEAKVWERILDEINDADTLVDVVERLARRSEHREAVRIAEFALGKRPDDWRLMFWAGYSHYLLGDVPAAKKSFEALLALPDDAKYDGTRARWSTSTGVAPQSPVSTLATLDLEECNAARVAFSRIRYLKEIQQLLAAKGLKSSSSTQPNQSLQQNQATAERQRLAAQQRQMQLLIQRAGMLSSLPRSQQLAKVDSAVMLFALGQEESGAQGWLRAKYETAKDDPAQLRLLVLVHVATAMPDDSEPAINRLAELLPDDPLPHIARLYAVDSTKRLQSLSAEAKTLRFQTIKAAADWIAANRPELRSAISQNYCNQLVLFGYLHEAAEFISRLLDDASRLQDITAVSRCVGTVRAPALSRKLLLRTNELAAGQTDAASINHVVMMLEKNYLATLESDDMDSVVDLFERYMEMTNPKRIATGTVPRARSTRVVTTSGTVAGTQQTSNVVSDFPCATSYLDAARYNALLVVYNRLKSSGKAQLLSERLAGGPAQMEGSAGHAYRLADIFVHWWSGERAEAIKLLAEMCDRVPGDPAMRLLLARAYRASDNYPQALRALAPLRANPGNLAKEIDQLTSLVTLQLAQMSVENVLDGLMVELASDGFEPQVGRFLGEPRQSSSQVVTANSPGAAPRMSGAATTQSSRSAAGTIRQSQINVAEIERQLAAERAALDLKTAATNSSGTRPVAAPLPPPMQTRFPELLDFARQQGKLDELQDATAQQVAKYPENTELLALLTLVGFARSDAPAMRVHATKWADRIESKQELADYPEAALIAFACLEHSDTRPVGHRLMRAGLQQAMARGRGELQQALLARWTRAYVEDGEIAEAERLVEQLVTLIGTDPSLTRKSGIDPAAARVYRLAGLAGHLHPTLLPKVLDSLARQAAKELDKIKQPSVIVQSLVEVVPRAMPSLSSDQQKQVRDALVALLFPFGPDHAPSLALWQSDTNWPVAGSLPGLIIALAKTDGELAQLRRQWDQHPESGTIDMLALRAEAALADGDLEAADRLLDRLEEIRQTGGLEPILWSEWFLFRHFRERLKAEFHQDFRGGKLDEQALELIGNDAAQFVKRENDGLRITLPAGAGKKGAVGVAGRFQLRGDFEVTATYELLDGPEPARLAGMILYLDFLETGNLASIQRARRAGEGNVYALHALISRLGRTDRWERSFPTDSRTGKLRVARQGSKLCFLVADGDSDDFRLLHRTDCNTTDIRAVRAVVDVQTAAAPYPVDVRWIDLTIRAEELPGLPTSLPPQ